MKMNVRKIGKAGLWALTGFCLLLVILAGIIILGAQSYVNKHLSDYISRKTGGLYHFRFESVELDFKLRGFSVYGLQLSPDSALAKKIQEENPQKVFYNLTTPQLSVIGLSPLKLLFDRKVAIENLSVIRPGFRLTGPGIFGNDSSKVFNYALEEIRPFFFRHLHEINIGKIDLIDASYQFYNLIGDTAQFSNAKSFAVGVLGFRVDSALLSRKAQPFETSDVFVRMEGFRNEMSDSLHQLSIDSLVYSLKKAELSAYRVSLKPMSKEIMKSLYDVYIPEFRMKTNDFRNIYLSDSINVSFLSVDNPKIKFYQKLNPRRIRIEDINNFDLYELVSKSYQSIRVDSFYIHGGSLQIFRQGRDTVSQQDFGKIDINLNRFCLDQASGSDPGKLFYADEIEMNIADYKLNLDDRVHRFSADSIFVSTYLRQIRVDGISICPAGSAQIPPHTKMDINCSSILLSGVGLKDVYHKRKLTTSKTEVYKPEVKIDSYTDVPESGIVKQGVFFGLVSAYLKGVYSDVVQISRGHLNYRTMRGQEPSGFFETGFSFSLTDFSIDSSSVKRTDKLFYARNFALNFSGYKMLLADNIHRLDVGQANISSRDNQVEIDSLHLHPAWPVVSDSLLRARKRSELFDIFIPNISLENTGLHQAFFENRLEIQKFKIGSPVIRYENFAALKPPRGKKEFSELYDLVFNYLDDISIASASAPDGKILWINHSKQGKTATWENNFSAGLAGFRLNKNEIGKKRILFSDQIELVLKDHFIRLPDKVHCLKAGLIDISTAKSSIEVRDALLYPDQSSPEYSSMPGTLKIAIPGLTAKNVDIARAYFSGQFNAGAITADSPEIDFYLQKGKTKPLDLKGLDIPLPEFVETLDVDAVKITNSRVTRYFADKNRYNLSSSFRLNLAIDGLNFRQDKTKAKHGAYSARDVFSSFSDFRFILNDKSHEIKVDKLDYHKNEKSIRISGLEVIPQESATNSNFYSLLVPDIRMEGLGRIKNNDEIYYSFSHIRAEKPKIVLKLKESLNKGGFRKIRDFDLYPYLKNYLDRLEVGKFELADADLTLNDFKQNNISLSLSRIDIGAKIKPGRFLNSDGLEIYTSRIERKSKDNRYTFTADTLYISTIKNQVELKNLHIKPNLPKEKFAESAGFQVDVVEGEIKRAGLDGFDFDAWDTDKMLKCRMLEIGPATLDIYRDKRVKFNQAQRPPWPQKLLLSAKRSFQFDSVKLLPSSIIYSELTDKNNSPAVVPFSDIKIRGGLLTNQRNILNKKPEFKMIASGRVFDSGKLNAEFDFDLSSPVYAHSVKGSLSPMAFSELNDVVAKSAPVTIEQGAINRFDFTLNANDTLSTGELYFGYDDFKIAILDYKNGEVQKARFDSFLANSLALHSKNPRGKTFEPEPIRYRRDPSRSVLNYWWKSLFSAAKSTFGIKGRQDKNKP